MLHALVSKRKGLSIKSRMLILTNKARLMYFDMQGTYKGSIPWSVTKPVSTHLVSTSTISNLYVFFSRLSAVGQLEN